MRIAPIFNHNWYKDEFQVTVEEIHELMSNQEETEIKNWFMLSVRISSYGCTREVWRGRKKRKSC